MAGLVVGTRVPAGAFFTEAEVVVAAKLLRQEQRKAVEAGATFSAAARSMLATCDELLEAQTYRAALQVAKLSQVHLRHSLASTCDTPEQLEHDDLTTAQAARTLHVSVRQFWRLAQRAGIEPCRRSPGRPSWWSPADVAALVVDRGSV